MNIMPRKTMICSHESMLFFAENIATSHILLMTITPLGNPRHVHTFDLLRILRHKSYFMRIIIFFSAYFGNFRLWANTFAFLTLLPFTNWQGPM
jgi:hypothetical protein